MPQVHRQPTDAQHPTYVPGMLDSAAAGTTDVGGAAAVMRGSEGRLGMAMRIPGCPLVGMSSDFEESGEELHHSGWGNLAVQSGQSRPCRPRADSPLAGLFDYLWSIQYYFFLVVSD